MDWKGGRQEIKGRWQPQRSPEQPLPGWAWQALVALFVFFIVLGASHSGMGMAQEVTAVAKRAVEADLTYDDVKAWVTKLPDTVAAIAGFDIEKFWAAGVTTKHAAFTWPCEGEVVSFFGWRTDEDTKIMSLHQGIDIAAEEGSKVTSSAHGIITAVRRSDSYGLMIEIEHGQGFSSVYAHLGSASVEKGQEVERGEIVGTVGESGRATAPHLHFEIRKDGVEMDPLTLLSPKSSLR